MKEQFEIIQIEKLLFMISACIALQMFEGLVQEKSDLSRAPRHESHIINNAGLTVRLTCLHVCVLNLPRVRVTNYIFLSLKLSHIIIFVFESHIIISRSPCMLLAMLQNITT